MTLGLEQTADSIIIVVRDNGPGIPPEAQPHIFERFYRADQARVRRDGPDRSGAGLGLAIAKWIAEAHGGRLVLVTSSTSGTTFHAILPFTSHSSPA